MLRTTLPMIAGLAFVLPLALHAEGGGRLPTARTALRWARSTIFAEAMRRTGASFLLLACTVLVGPIPADAQMSDRAADMTYCARLAATYDRYNAPSDYERAHVSRNLETDLAKAKCRDGDTMTGIPILERKLGDARIGLPSR